MFTWKPIYREIADKLPEFAADNRELVKFMVSIERGRSLCRRERDTA